MREVDLVALAGLMHDIGKFGQRADIAIEKDSYDFQSYCPMRFGEHWTHQHSAYSADFLKSAVGKQGEYSFIDPKIGEESFENISAKHHKPTTPKEWIVAIADRVASGFEREEFDKYNSADDREHKKLKYYEVPLDSVFDEKMAFELKAFTNENIFATTKKSYSKKEYAELYKSFEKDMETLKKKQKENFYYGVDYLLKKYTSFIPSSTYGTKANIPLYDHLKTTAAFASALYGYHGEESDIAKIKDYQSKKFLLIAGDFFGIQKFIFDSVPTKRASKILRGKSAFIQILTKVIALDICKKIGISSLSVVSDSAGKFEILAPNTEEVKKTLATIQEELNSWFIKETFGESGIGISTIEASAEDFVSNNFPHLRENLAKQVEAKKYQKFDLQNRSSIIESETKDNEHLCKLCLKRFKKDSGDESCSFCDIFIKLGEKLAKTEFISINKKGEIPIYDGYFVSFGNNIDEYSEVVYDISNSEEFRGYAKWALRTYVKYSEYEERIEEFEELSLESCGGESSQGVKALMSLKGDVDSMGDFLRSSNINSFAKFNFISRLIDYFFSVRCSVMMEGKNLYTIFAGGDDLFIIGAWDEVIDSAKEIRKEFMRFAKGSRLSFSVGMVMFKPSKPINYIADVSEKALEHAKEIDKNKDAITLFGETVKWDEYLNENRMIDELEKLDSEKLNTALLYRLIEFAQMSIDSKSDVRKTIWRSKLRYFFSRNIGDGHEKLFEALDDALSKNPEVTKMKLFEYIYKRRKV